MLKINNLAFSYKEDEILKNINFTLNKGEILALLGPNGSGKSTLLRCINGILKPDKGKVIFDNYNIAECKRKWISKKIAFLPQQLDIVDNITVWELISRGRYPYQTMGWRLNNKDRDKIQWAIEQMNLEHLQHRSLHNLSGGERQRVWIAMILVQDTDLILLDEPVTYLDLKYQWDLLQVIQDIRDLYNKSFILVLHDINNALMTADRAVVLNEGKIHAQGEANNILTSNILKEVYGLQAQICKFAGCSHSMVVPEKISS